MSKIYAHFLGYSKTEGGVVEINTVDTFDIGSIDLETGETEFDDFSFKCQNSVIFETRPQSNEAFLLESDIKGVGVVTSAIISGVTTPSDGDLIWIENERCQLFETSGGKFDIYREKNSSIAVAHRYFSVDGRNKLQITITKKRISPIGLIVKIYSDSKIFAYGQITNVSKINSGFVSITCQNLYKQLEKSTIETRTTENRSRYYSYLGNTCEFSRLLDNPYIFFAPADFKEQDYSIFQDNKEWFQQNINAFNLFLSFNKLTGRYTINKFGRVYDTSQIEKRLISKSILRNAGVFEVECQNPVSSVTIKTKATEEFTVINSDSNFANYYTSAKKAEIDLEKCFIPVTDDVESTVRNLAYYKMFMLNSIVEKISFSVDRYNPNYEVGKYYKLLDIYKFDTFYKDDGNLTFLCVSIDEVKASFVRTDFSEAKQVAPAFIVKKTAANTYIAENLDGLQDYVTCFDTTKEIENLQNPVTNSVCFEASDDIILFGADGTLTETTITTLSGNTFTLTTNTGSVGDLFVLSIQNYNTGSIQSKNSSYLFDNGLGVI